MSDEIATLSIQRPCSTPVAALRATEKRVFPTSLNGHGRRDDPVERPNRRVAAVAVGTPGSLTGQKRTFA